MGRGGPKPKHIPKSVMDFAWEFIVEHEQQFRRLIEYHVYVPHLIDDAFSELVPKYVAHAIMDYKHDNKHQLTFYRYAYYRVKERIKQWVKRELHKHGSWRHESVEVLMKTSKKSKRDTQLSVQYSPREIDVETAEEIQILRRWVESNLSDELAAIYEYYYIDEYTDLEIGKMIGMSRSEVCKRRIKIEQAIYTRKSEIFPKASASTTQT